MKQEQRLFNGLAASLMTFLLLVFNCQCVYAQAKSDSFNYNRDLNKLLSNTKLVKEIEFNSSRNRNRSQAKRIEKKVASNKRNKPVTTKLVKVINKSKTSVVSTPKTALKNVEHNTPNVNISNYDSSIVYQSKTILDGQSKLESFRTILNELGIANPDNSSVVKKQLLPNILKGKFATKPAMLSTFKTTTPSVSPKLTSKKQNSYWATLHFIESSSGKRLYRKRNKARSCKWTTTPCGHHQLSVQALKDIGCKSLKCRSAREDYKQSLSMSKKLEKINVARMKKKGHKSLPEYQRYLVHQQGATGLGRILDAYKGKKNLSKKTLKYMANNSPYSYKNLRRSGSRGAARKFLHHWEEKWKINQSRRVASR